MLSVSSEITGAEIFGVVGEEIGKYSIFWCIWTKLAAVGCVSGDTRVVECDCCFMVVEDKVCEEKMAKFRENSLVGW
jgi:hypothetical protein